MTQDDEKEAVKGSQSNISKKIKRNSQPKTKEKQCIGTCFILTPFREPFDTYYIQIIEPAVKSVSLKPLRGDSLFRPAPIVDDIWRMIQQASILVAELTTKNANVFYELGLAHSIGKPVVLIAESVDDIPFDLQSLRVLLYDKNDPAWGRRLQSNLTSALIETLEEPIDSVPPTFRTKVKSQAPEDSELSLRVAALELTVRSLAQDSRTRRAMVGPASADRFNNLTDFDKAVRDTMDEFRLGQSVSEVRFILKRVFGKEKAEAIWKVAMEKIGSG